MRGGKDPALVPERQRDQREQQRRRQHDDRDEQDLRPKADVREVRRDDEPRDVDGGDGDEGRDTPRRQYGGSSAHHVPSTLKAFQNAVFAWASSSASSISGVINA